MKLGIGTAQFGLDYGISNQDGKIREEEVEKILNLAVENGIQVLDTALAYGTSEEVLGKMLPLNHKFKIITKTPHFSKSCITYDDAQFLEDSFYKSLRTLNQESIYGLLIHNVNDVFVENGHFLIDKMLDFQKYGLIEKIGVSLYTGEDIDKILERYTIDLIQLPINILDQRLIRSGHLYKLKELGVEIHARSIFLQGLLLMNSEQIPPYFNSIKEQIKDLHNFIISQGLSPLQAAIAFINYLQEIDIVIVGLNNYQHLQEIIDAAQKSILLSLEDFYPFGITDPYILNPTNWRI
ncbi:aldo/keto reductase [Nostoc sp. TCL26-01]|uniref:aldo/keto reductase n=1 Tax=Nostoc sp. TCL26-01 TaxID=2576904 RepID=UPI0015B8DFD7|nr:aldo/keto reductase [Nostoc sp. TCL26-01]QLE59133.1 aryl-alcohol dehydrogenase [Nostoc sp. TCL26-01]